MDIRRADQTDRVGVVEVDELRCPGCDGPVVGQPPAGWPRGAGLVPEFSHLDGSVLCPDGRGRIGEPVETGRAGRDLIDGSGVRS